MSHSFHYLFTIFLIAIVESSPMCASLRPLRPSAPVAPVRARSRPSAPYPDQRPFAPTQARRALPTRREWAQAAPLRRHTNCKPCSTPLTNADHLTTITTDDKLTDGPYRQLIGSLNYAACLTRPDIVYVVNLLSKYCSNPMQKNWSAAKQVLRYLSGTSSLGLTFQKENEMKLRCYSDSDWGETVRLEDLLVGHYLSYVVPLSYS